jgi:hypothetical protein
MDAYLGGLRSDNRVLANLLVGGALTYGALRHDRSVGPVPEASGTVHHLQNRVGAVDHIDRVAESLEVARLEPIGALLLPNDSEIGRAEALDEDR